MAHTVLSSNTPPADGVQRLQAQVNALVEEGRATRLEGYREKVFLDRYALKDSEGKPLEQHPEQMWLRVAKTIAAVETEDRRAEWTAKFYDVLQDFRFVPGGRILSGAGSGTEVTYYNCFVIPSPEDSVEGIFENIKVAADIMRRSGGVGVNLSSLRPRGAYIKTVNGTSSGPCSWGILYSDMTGKVIIQGGCFGPDERIHTDKGLIPAKELADRLESGEVLRAQTHEGWRPLTAYFRNGTKPLMEVTTARGYKVRVTPEHKMAVLRDGEITTVPLAELAVGDEVLLLLGDGVDAPYQPLAPLEYKRSVMSTTLNEAVQLPDTLTEGLAYLLGYFYGDGTVIQGRKVTWAAPKGISLSVTNSRPEITERLIREISENFGLTAVTEQCAGNWSNIKVYSRLLVEWLQQNGLLKGKAADVTVPEVVYRSPSTVMAAFVGGYFDADGCDRTSKGGYGIDSISLPMLRGLQQLMLANGIVSHISTTQREHGWQTIHRLAVTGAEFKARFNEWVSCEKNLAIAGHRSHGSNYPMEAWKSLDIPGRYYQGLFDSTKQSVGHYALTRVRERLIRDGQVEMLERLDHLLSTLPDYITSIQPVGQSDVYDFEVDEVHLLAGSGVYTSNSRRGALMLMLDDDHPDVEEFIEYKRKNPGHIDHANLSVCVSDAFMDAVKNDLDWDLKWQGKVWRTVRARDLWRKIAESAHAYAEPGVVFIDRYNKRSNTWYFENIRCVNPCVTGDTLVYTGAGLFPAAELAEIGSPIAVASPSDNSVSLRQASHVFPTGVKPVYRLETREGYSLRLTGDHRVLTTEGWKEARDLLPGDRIRLLNGEAGFGVGGNLDEGRVLGWLVGDGYINKRREGSVVLSFFGQDRVLANQFAQTVNRMVAAPDGVRQYRVGVNHIDGRDESRVESVRLLRAIDPELMENKLRVPPSVLRGSREMQVGFLQGLFSADGTVSGTPEKGMSVRLASSSPALLADVQRLLLNLGIWSRIYQDRRASGARSLPDGRGGRAEYGCNADHELIITRTGLPMFAEKIGFLTDAKQEKLAQAQADRVRGFYQQEYVATFESLVPDGEEMVYDLTEPEAHLFVANGLVVHNCGEQGLPAWGVCNLGAINLLSFVKEIEGEKYFDFEDLAQATKVSIRFLDDVIDATNYPFDENREAQQYGARRTGLGTMGIADVLIKLGLKYGSQEAMPIIEQIYKTIRDAAYEGSAELAAEKGPFPKFDREKYLAGEFIRELPIPIQEKIAEHGIRNAVLLTQAPTGTTSSLAGVNSGIEPVFAFVTKRTDRLGEHLLYHPLAQEWTDAHPDEPLPDYFVASGDLTPHEHVGVQAMVQRYTDSSISKTVNGPSTDTVEFVEQLYLDAYDMGCKGVTYYRQGSRDAVLEAVTEKAAEKVAEKVAEIQEQQAPAPSVPATIKPRPQLVQGYTRQIRAPEGKVNITLNSDDAGLFEVFINLGKAGSDIAAMAEALGRLISLNLQMPSPMTADERAWEIGDQLRGIGGSRTVGFGPGQVKSLPDAVAQALLKHLQRESVVESSVEDNGNGHTNGHGDPAGDHDDETPQAVGAAVTAQQLLERTVQLTGNLCPSCGCNSLIAQEGCRKCYVCGHSEC